MSDILIDRGYEEYDVATQEYRFRPASDGDLLRVHLAGSKTQLYHIEYAGRLGRALVKAAEGSDNVKK